MTPEQEREALDLLRLAMGYVRAFGSTGSAPVIVDRHALDAGSDALLRRYEAFETLAWEGTQQSP